MTHAKYGDPGASDEEEHPGQEAGTTKAVREHPQDSSGKESELTVSSVKSGSSLRSTLPATLQVRRAHLLAQRTPVLAGSGEEVSRTLILRAASRPLHLHPPVKIPAFCALCLPALYKPLPFSSSGLTCNSQTA